MKQPKAKRLYTGGTPYYWESEFEYRGQTYTVTYSSGFSAFNTMCKILPSSKVGDG